MMFRSYWIYLLLLGIQQSSVHSYGGRYIEGLRMKRQNPSNTTLINQSTDSFTSMSSPSPLLNNASNISLTYIITSYSPLATSMHTIEWINQTNSVAVSTMSSTITMILPTPSNIVSPYNPDNCQDHNLTRLFNNTCVMKFQAQQIAADILRNSFSNTTDIVYALFLYISAITNSTTLYNRTNTLSAAEIDDMLDSLRDLNLTLSSNTSFLTILNPLLENNIIVLGASFKRGIGGEVIDTTNKDNITSTFLSAAAMVTRESLNGVASLNLLIIDKPTGYENADNSPNRILASSVVVANIIRNSSTYDPIIIFLYFTPLKEYEQTGEGQYVCSFYDTNHSQWNESGCSGAYHNSGFNRYECNCTHLTSFALIWLPQSISPSSSSSSGKSYNKYLDPQDIASLIFQCISILCFLAIMIHAIGIRYRDRSRHVPTIKLLPLVSTASTTILFIFFIALGLTVRTNTSSFDETECFLSSSVLMFITYFLIILMFCAKTSVGYFYYLRFVRLFPHTSHRQLFFMLAMSVFISLTCVTLAIGLNAHSSYHITRLYPYKLCWFTRDVIYYFMTIPIGIFLVLNIITITLVSRSIITHAFHAGNGKQISERLKRCVVVLLSSCVTQGLGWFFGPFITFLNPIAGNIIAWFFLISNALEGFWSIILYSLIRSQHISEEKHTPPPIQRLKSAKRPATSEKKVEHRLNSAQRIEKTPWYIFNDLRKRETEFSSDDGNDHRAFQ